MSVHAYNCTVWCTVLLLYRRQEVFTVTRNVFGERYNGLLDSETKHNQVEYNTEQTNIIKNNINIKHDVSSTDCNLYNINDIHNIS